MPPSVARLEAEPITLETVRAVAKANFDAGYRFEITTHIAIPHGFRSESPLPEAV